MKNLLIKEFGPEINHNSKGYYKIISKEVKALIRFDKNNKQEEIVSHDLNRINNVDVYFTGKKHVNGKIFEEGKCFKFNENSEFITLKSGYLKYNKFDFIKIIFKPNEDNNNLYKTMPDLFDFDKSSEAKSFLHKHNLKYKSADYSWICDFCLKPFEIDDVSFGYRECDYDLCKKCIFEDENKTRNQMYIRLVNLNVNVIKYNKKELIIKSNYHKHEIIYKENIFEENHCCICEKSFIEVFVCEECKNYICLDCIMKEDKERNSLINKLNNCFFSININNFTEKIYGYFIKNEKDSNSNEHFSLVLNNSWKELKSYVKKDFFEIMLFNDNKIKIFVKDIIEYILILDNNSTHLKVKRNNNLNENSGIFELVYEIIKENNKKLIDFNNKPIIIPIINDDKKIELNYEFLNIEPNNEKEFIVNYSELSKENSEFPILLLNNTKIFGFYKKFENDRHIASFALSERNIEFIDLKEYTCYIFFIMKEICSYEKYTKVQIAICSVLIGNLIQKYKTPLKISCKFASFNITWMHYL